MRTGASPCWDCGYVVDGVTPADALADRYPEPDQVVLCIACGALSIVVTCSAELMVLRMPTAEEHRQLLTEPQVIRAVGARALAARRFPDEWPQPGSRT